MTLFARSLLILLGGILSAAAFASSALADASSSEIPLAYTVNFTTCEVDGVKCRTTLMGFEESRIPLSEESKGYFVGSLKLQPTESKGSEVFYDLEASTWVYQNGQQSSTLTVYQTVTRQGEKPVRTIVGSTSFQKKIDGVISFHGQKSEFSHQGLNYERFVTLQIAGR